MSPERPVYRLREVLFLLRDHPRHAHLTQAARCLEAISEGRRAGVVCQPEVYSRLFAAIDAALLSCPDRCVPFGDGSHLGAPPPVWSLAMSIRAKVQGQHFLAYAHLRVAIEQLVAPLPVQTRKEV